MTHPSTAAAAEQTSLAFDCRTECFTEDVPEGQESPRIVMVAISHTGGVETVCTYCIHDRITNPDLYPEATYHGTHVLSEQTQRQLFPED